MMPKLPEPEGFMDQSLGGGAAWSREQVEQIQREAVAQFLDASGQYVTNYASRQSTIDQAVVNEREALNDMRISLVNAIHSLASDFENIFCTLDYRSWCAAKASVSHAREVARRWNYNGPLQAEIGKAKP